LIGFTTILESGYDDENDLLFIVMNKLDEDLNEIISKSEAGKLSL
jgi:hypothetical protein